MESERYHREAPEFIRAWYGNDRFKTASALTMVARSIIFQKRDDEAIAIDDATLTPDHMNWSRRPASETVRAAHQGHVLARWSGKDAFIILWRLGEVLNRDA